MFVQKKDGQVVPFDSQKIITAVAKSAERVEVRFLIDDYKTIIDFVEDYFKKSQIIKADVPTMHRVVELALDKVNPLVAKSYRDYRNYKTDFVAITEEVYQKSKDIMYRGDRDNANTDSALIPSKRSLVYGELNKEFYKKFFLTPEENKAIKEGYIYIHDLSARRDTYNCCLYDAAAVMKGGFDMGNIHYTEPKTIDVACDVLSDVIMTAASSQYGGLSVRIDDLLAPYCEKSFKKYFSKYMAMFHNACGVNDYRKHSKKQAREDTIRDLEQGLQGLEIKFNSVSSSRGDYPFLSFAFGIGESEWEKEVTKAALKVRMDGQGKEGFKRPVLFPKLIFLYDEELHGKGKSMEDIFDLGIECSSKCMYPDFYSIAKDGAMGKLYQKHKVPLYQMGCRALLSPWYERGGMGPADENDLPVFTGRFNIGAITLNLIMILAKAREENKDFYEVLGYYMQMIREVHLRTYQYLGEMRASTNPLAFCEGGLLGGHLQPHEQIAPLLWPMTASFGYTGLNELQYLYNGKSIYEDGEFCLEVMQYINCKTTEYKKEDGRLYAVYGTPAEKLAGLQIQQFRQKYGIIPNVSSREYTSNSFHCGVWEDIDPIEKQDSEERFWNLSNGGKIQYVRYPIDYNLEAFKTLVRRAMGKGFYEGINLELCYCADCGHSEIEMGETCPQCGSSNLVKVNRINGYLGYSQIGNRSMMNDAKLKEISERKSM